MTHDRTADPPVAVHAREAPLRAKKSVYPAVFAARVAGREKRPLGELFALKNFGVNLVHLAPGAQSALRHAHSAQDEFVYVIEGCATLVTDAGETPLSAGMCAGFRAGSGDGHHLFNRTSEPVVYLEVGDRSPGDTVVYPDDDLVAHFVDGAWRFTRRDGSAYSPP